MHNVLYKEVAMFVIQKILLKPIAIDKLNATNSEKQKKERHDSCYPQGLPQPTDTHKQQRSRAEHAHSLYLLRSKVVV